MGIDFVKLKDDGDSMKKRKARFSWKKFFLILLIVFVLSSIISSISYSLSPKVGIVPIKGAIMTGESNSIFGGSSVSSRYISNTIRNLADDDSVVSIVLDINSPGGSAVASEEISNAIEYAKEKKNVYAYASDLAASGAFWVGVSASEFYSSRLTLMGSIGVTMAGLSFEEFIEEYNITYRRLTAGEFKDIGSTYREMTLEEEKMIQNILDETHEVFITHVAQSRNLSLDLVKEYSQGQVFLGSLAQEKGFIDGFKSFEDVVELAKENSTGVLVVEFAQEPTLAEALGVSAPDLFLKYDYGLKFE